MNWQRVVYQRNTPITQTVFMQWDFALAGEASSNFHELPPRFQHQA